ncbi:MAG: tyrosine-type recombinase/integrase, partial [Myxococcota bacterium]
ELLYGAAVRCTEARRLKVEDLELEEGRATVLGKGKRVRRVFLGAAAVAALRAYLASTGIRAGWIFRNRDGRRVSRRLICRVVEKYAAKSGVAHSSPHTMRHSSASHLLARGAYIFNVSEILGHRSVATTAAYYAHWIDPGEDAQATHRRCHPRA